MKKENDDVKDILKGIKPKLPNKEIEYFNRFIIICSKAFTLDEVIEKETDVFPHVIYEVVHLLEKHDYEKAHNLMGEYVMKLQLRRDFGPMPSPHYSEQRSRKIRKIMEKKTK